MSEALIGRRAFVGSALLAAAAAARPAWSLGVADAAGVGRVIAFPAMHSAYVEPRDVTIWLPNGYVGCTCRHPVVYLNDGERLAGEVPASRLTDRPAPSLEAAIAHYAVDWPAVIVAISSTAARNREYCPAAPPAMLSAPLRQRIVGACGGAPASDDYLKFIVRELKPLVDRTLRTLPRCGDTMIAGTGMGGLLSLYAVSQYPDVFGGAACFAGEAPLVPAGAVPEAMHAGRDVRQGIERYLMRSFPRAGRHRVYVDGGRNGDLFDAPFRKAVSRALAARRYVAGGDFVSATLETATDEPTLSMHRAARAMTLLLGRYYRHPSWEVD